MSPLSVSPNLKQVNSTVHVATALANALRESGLVENINPHLLPDAQWNRFGEVVRCLTDFELEFNPQRKPWPLDLGTGVVGWPDGSAVMQALVDLEEVLRFVLSAWGLEKIAGASSWGVNVGIPSEKQLPKSA